MAASPTTWALVAIRPSAEITKPVPVPLPLDITASMRTTLGRTVSKRPEMSAVDVTGGASSSTDWASGVATATTESGAEARPATAPPTVPPAIATSASATAAPRPSRVFPGAGSGNDGGPAGGRKVGGMPSDGEPEVGGLCVEKLGGLASYTSTSFRVRWIDSMETILRRLPEGTLNPAEGSFSKPIEASDCGRPLLAHCAA